MTETEKFEGWAIVELMGHRQVAGKVNEHTQFGVAMLRIDVPGPSGEIAVTQLYGGAAIYGVTPCDEAHARQINAERYALPPMVAVAFEHDERRSQPALPGLGPSAAEAAYAGGEARDQGLASRDEPEEDQD